MSSWLLQPGMPLVTLSIENSTLKVSQRPSSRRIAPEQLWWVPLHVKVTPVLPSTHAALSSAPTPIGVAARSGQPSTLFLELSPSERSAAVELPPNVANGDCFIQGNFNFSAFVLVNYSDPTQWLHLVSHMTQPGFPAIDRQQLEKQLGYLAELEYLDFLGNASTAATRRAELCSPSGAHLGELIRGYGNMGVFKDGLAGVARVVAIAGIIRRLIHASSDVRGNAGVFDALAHAFSTVLLACATSGSEDEGRTDAVDGALMYWGTYFYVGTDESAQAQAFDRYTAWVTASPRTVHRQFRSLDQLRAAAPLI